MSSKNLRAVSIFSVICGALFLISYDVSARLFDITLSDLVEKSDLIVYGSVDKFKIKQTAKGRQAVGFNVTEKFKGEKIGGRIFLCNTKDDSESYDFEKTDGRYIVFAKDMGECYEPVHGIRSVIQISNETAHTLVIKDQPCEQGVKSFIKKIKSEI